MSSFLSEAKKLSAEEYVAASGGRHEIRYVRQLPGVHD
jgi:hypothetical protein